MSLYTQDQKSERPWHGRRIGLPSYDIPYIHEKVLRIKADALKSFYRRPKRGKTEAQNSKLSFEAPRGKNV